MIIVQVAAEKTSQSLSAAYRSPASIVHLTGNANAISPIICRLACQVLALLLHLPPLGSNTLGEKSSWAHGLEPFPYLNLISCIPTVFQSSLVSTSRPFRLQVSTTATPALPGILLLNRRYELKSSCTSSDASDFDFTPRLLSFRSSCSRRMILVALLAPTPSPWYRPDRVVVPAAKYRSGSAGSSCALDTYPSSAVVHSPFVL